MNDTPSLFAECPLPGCTYPVDDPRWPCGEREAALAGYIRPSAQLVTVEEAAAMLTDRDEAVAAIYAERRTMVPLPELAEVTPAAEPGPQAQHRQRPGQLRHAMPARSPSETSSAGSARNATPADRTRTTPAAGYAGRARRSHDATTATAEIPADLACTRQEK